MLAGVGSKVLAGVGRAVGGDGEGSSSAEAGALVARVLVGSVVGAPPRKDEQPAMSVKPRASASQRVLVDVFQIIPVTLRQGIDEEVVASSRMGVEHDGGAGRDIGEVHDVTELVDGDALDLTRRMGLSS